MVNYYSGVNTQIAALALTAILALRAAYRTSLDRGVAYFQGPLATQAPRINQPINKGITQ